MPKHVYCEMCDKFFTLTRTSFCPLCGDTLRKVKGGPKITDPRATKRTPDEQFAVDPIVGAPLGGLRAPNVVPSDVAVSRVPDQGSESEDVAAHIIAAEQAIDEWTLDTPASYSQRNAIECFQYVLWRQMKRRLEALGLLRVPDQGWQARETLEDWEIARLCGRLDDEVSQRTSGRFSRANTLGDPVEIPMLEKAARILRSHRKLPAPPSEPTS